MEPRCCWLTTVLLLLSAVACLLPLEASAFTPHVGAIFENRYELLAELPHHQKISAQPPAGDDDGAVSLLQLPFPTDLGRAYNAIAEKSSGTFGNVWKVKKLATGEVIALKFFFNPYLKETAPKEFLKHSDIARIDLSQRRIDYMHSECQWPDTIANRLPKDPRAGYFMKCLGSYLDGKKSDYMYLELSYAGDVPLERYGAESPISSLGTLQMAVYQIISALDYLTTSDSRAAKLIHHDLKDANIMTNGLAGADFKLTLVDYGEMTVCNADNDRYMATTEWWAGPEYSSANAFCNPSRCDCSTFDMYSAGVTFGNMLCGSNWFAHDLHTQKEVANSAAGFEKFLNNLFAARPQVRNWLRETRFKEAGGLDLLRSMLLTDPVNRLTASEALSYKFLQSAAAATAEAAAAAQKVRARQAAAAARLAAEAAQERLEEQRQMRTLTAKKWAAALRRHCSLTITEDDTSYLCCSCEYDWQNNKVTYAEPPYCPVGMTPCTGGPAGLYEIMGKPVCRCQNSFSLMGSVMFKNWIFSFNDYTSSRENLERVCPDCYDDDYEKRSI
eukprot:gnl/Hemi2/1073_TR385_c0_g1_i1.p1 gnl/Hemi2/1073_TR385_c0_g1~~gnl/Hemi2/1073_TR385_c0_g1_i1.p1  ORF type:complete len:558 (-),score=140.75 gnl/Hemi2/1073_TR385_c0_g1_i1:52-1725(-)